MEETRTVGNYIISQAIEVGRQEIVIGEFRDAEPGQKYMCAFCHRSAIAAMYDQVMVSDDYTEILKIFGDRIAQTAENVKKELEQYGLTEEDKQLVSNELYESIQYGDDLREKIVVIRPEVLKPEYQSAPFQLRYCTGGFGASPNSRGSACFCVSFLDGKTSRFERMDIMGIMPAENLPEWAKAEFSRCKVKSKAEREER